MVEFGLWRLESCRAAYVLQTRTEAQVFNKLSKAYEDRQSIGQHCQGNYTQNHITASKKMTSSHPDEFYGIQKMYRSKAIAQATTALLSTISFGYASGLKIAMRSTLKQPITITVKIDRRRSHGRVLF